jgi:hypothetical protein
LKNKIKGKGMIADKKKGLDIGKETSKVYHPFSITRKRQKPLITLPHKPPQLTSLTGVYVIT